jgi:hypothetical protein
MVDQRLCGLVPSNGHVATRRVQRDLT